MSRYAPTAPALTHPEDPMQLQPFAEPFVAPGEPDAAGQRVGVLLCHGFTGSPASMLPWARYLNEQGYGVSAPRLPGHGTRWQDMQRTTWQDWYDEVTRAFEKMRADHDKVVVAGLSMGGALALRLAADRGREVEGVILVNPAVNIDRKDIKLVPVLKYVVPAMPGVANDIKKPGVDEHGYSRTPLKALHSMLQGYKALCPDLPKITCPVLFFRSVEDHVVDPSSSRIILGALSSRDVTERMLEDSYHVATLDNDAPAIFEESAEFVRRVTAR
jgi:carboxylesterase